MTSRARLRSVVVPLLLLLLAAGILFGFAWSAGLRDATFSTEGLEALIRGWGIWGAAGSVALMVLHTFLPFPAELLVVANGLVFGFTLGVVVSWVGAMVAALSAFALARRFGRPLLRRILTERQWRRAEQWTGQIGPGSLLVLRLLPVVSFNLINLAAGAAGVGWWRFTWTTAIGVLPAVVVCVLAGSHVLDAPWAAGLLLAALVLAGMAASRWWRRRREAGSDRTGCAPMPPGTDMGGG